MALIQVREVELQSPNPAPLTETFRWRMLTDVLAPLDGSMEVSFVWVGSASSAEYDQILDRFEVGPFNVGANAFFFEHDPPNPALIPPQDLVGPTVFSILFAYKSQVFLRVSYYVNVAYWDDTLNMSPPQPHVVEALARNVCMDRPNIGVLPITWGDVPYDEYADQ